MALILGVLLCLAGCYPQMSNPSSQPSEQASAAEALALLQAQADKVMSLKIYAQCRMGLPNEDGVLKEQPPFDVRIYLDPPYNVYMDGIVGMGASGKVEMGSNAEFFWMGIKLEMDEFWWGRWDKTSNHEDMQVSPKAMMEALGVLQLGDPASWSLSKQQDLDVLTQVGPTGQIIRQIKMKPGESVPQRIEYYNRQGEISLVVELAQYATLPNGFKVPQEIGISAFQADQCSHYVRLSVRRDGVKKKTYSEKLRQNIFRFDASKLAGYRLITEVTE